MTLTQMYLILKYRFNEILRLLFLTIIFFIIVSILVPNKYKTTSSLLINYKYIDPISGATIPSQLIPSFMETQVDIIKSKSVVYLVIDKLNLQNLESYKDDFLQDTNGEGDFKDWIADELLKKLIVQPSRISSKIDITFKDNSPEFAANMANAFSDAYIQKNTELKVDPSKSAANFYGVQISELKAKMESAGKKYQNYQRDNKILNSDGSLDVETGRMNELSNQLLAVQAKLADMQSRNQVAQSQIYDSPDVTADEVVQLLKQRLLTAKASFSDVSSKYSKKHPDYIAAQLIVKEVEEALSKQMNSVANTVHESLKMLKQRENSLINSLEKQKLVVSKLNSRRNELHLIEQELVAAEDSFNAAHQRFDKSNFEGESELANATILSSAVVPREPYFPRFKLNILISVFLGLFFGVTYVLLTELLDRKLRGDEDILSTLDFPFFGELPNRSLKKSGIFKLKLNN